MGASQSTYVTKGVPDLLQVKTYKREKLNVGVTEDLVRVAHTLVDYSVEKEVPRFCNGTLHDYHFRQLEIDPDKMEGIVTDVLKQPAMPLDSAAKNVVKNAMWARSQEPPKEGGNECWWLLPCLLATCSPLCCVLLPVFLCQVLPKYLCPPPDATELDKLKKVQDLMKALKAINEEIKSVEKTAGCCCFMREMEANETFVRRALQFIILSEIYDILATSMGGLLVDFGKLMQEKTDGEIKARNERAEKRQLLNPADQRIDEEAEFLGSSEREVKKIEVNIPNESVFIQLGPKDQPVSEIEVTNLVISEVIRKRRVTNDDIANQLLTWMDSDFVEDPIYRWKKFIVFPNNTWMSQSCESSQFVSAPSERDKNAWEEAILKNYHALTGGKMDVIPSNLKPIVDLLGDFLHIVGWTARVKSPESILKNFEKGDLPGTVTDIFGMRLFVSERNVFQAFSKASMCAHRLSETPGVKGIATKHSLKKESSWFDFKMVLKLKCPGEPIAEIQIVPIQNFISDEHMGGHDMHKRGTASNALKSIL